MITPAQEDVTVVRGTTDKWVYQFVTGDPEEAIPLDDVRLTFYKSITTPILRVTLSGGGFVSDGLTPPSYIWTPTPEQTRLIPKKENGCFYELEVWNGPSELVYVMGNVTGIGGGNDDD